MKNLLFVILTLLFPLASVAQEPQGKPFVPQSLEDVNRVSDLTLDSINIAKSARPIPGSSRKGTNPVLFLVGNSTMRTGTLGNGNNGQWGWGYFAHLYFDESRISVENHALGGTSSRTFYRRLWPEVHAGIREGDWVIIELGHNDNGPYDEGRARASIPGVGKDSLEVTIKETGEKETIYSYGEYMRRFILDVRSRGANPILCSLTPRNSWEADGTITRTDPSLAVLGQGAFRCPSFNEEKLPSGILSAAKERTYLLSGYGWNWGGGSGIYGMGYGSEQNTRPYVKPTQVALPSETIVFGDGLEDPARGTQADCYSVMYINYEPFRHGGNSMAINWADSHATVEKTYTIKSGKSGSSSLTSGANSYKYYYYRLK